MKRTALLAILMLMLSAPMARASPVTLAWNSNTEADLAAYKIYHGDASRAYSVYEKEGIIE